MAGMTDTAFRRLVKRQGGCGLVVTEMVSSEGLVRGIDRTLEYAEYTEEERPVSIQIFGGDPDEDGGGGADRRRHGRRHRRRQHGLPRAEDREAQRRLQPDARARARGARHWRDGEGGRIPVTVKMRAGWNDRSRNAPELARMVQDAGAAAVTIHGRTAEQSYSGLRRLGSRGAVANELTIPVLGSGDCVEPTDIVRRMRAGVSGVLVGRGVLRNPWILAQAADLAAGRPPRDVTLQERGEFLSSTSSCCSTSGHDERDGFRHLAPGSETAAPARGRERWVINKVRALCAWYSKGLDGGSQLRARVNTAAASASCATSSTSSFLRRRQPRRKRKRYWARLQT